ncbi:MAG: hypothetical protein JNK85_05850 [Verrucomicrobiales bacterium]|nr:hypothetical protein [Verrucomicrobiales bacterium]
MIRVLLTWIGLFSLLGATRADPVVIQTAGFEYRIATNGANLAFIDRATGVDYLRHEASTSCIWVRANGTTGTPTAAAVSDGRLLLRFAPSELEVALKVEVRTNYVVFTVDSVRGGEIQELKFLNVPLTLQGLPSEPFGACVHALNLRTRVDALPALQRDLGAACETKFGLLGAKAALVAVPTSRMLSVLQEVLSKESELPVCKVAGPWARETPFAHGSYLFNFGALETSNVDGWIETVRSLGFSQTDHHGGSPGFFRFGDFELNREKWPEGWSSFRRVVDRLHQAGIGSIFHTYAFFIDKKSKYVTPVPDRRLDAFRVFTLAAPLTKSATELVVNEPTAGIQTTTGFFEANSVVLHVGDELVTFGGASKQAPWTFTGLTRGALGTKAAEHQPGTQARHLKEMFGLFVPDVASTLFEEIAANHAQVVNDCGFDGLYLDAIDGSGILRGNDEFWYWSQKFVIEIQKRLNKPVGMEMSAMAHHFWQYRTRWQAWDYPRRGHKRFIDLHAAGVDAGLLLPLHLGWWNLQAFEPPQCEPTYPDVMEHLGARMIGWDAGVSLTAAVNRGALRETPLFRRAVEILQTCEQLRASKAYDDAARAELRESGNEFRLGKDPTGRPRFLRVHSASQVVARDEPWSERWTVTNRGPVRPIRLRIEALMSADTRQGSAEILVDPADMDASSWTRSTANGVRCDVQRRPDEQGGGRLLVATNAGVVPRNAAWAKAVRLLAPTRNLKERQGLHVEINGDGSGAWIAIRLESPSHLSFGGFADRYVVVDFVGRRQLTLVETESARWSDFVWNDAKGLYHAYRESAHWEAVESVGVWLQNLAPGRETRIGIGPVQAVRLRTNKVVNPRISIGGKTIEWVGGIGSGGWIEANGPDDCTAFGPKGENLGKIEARGEWPLIQPGVSELRFTCDAGPGESPRVRLVTTLDGEFL